MKNINVNELSIKELKELASELFPDMTLQGINSTAIGVLQTMVLEELEYYDSLEDREEEYDLEISSSIKHSPSRKKKANRVKKDTIKYKKVKKSKEAVQYKRRKVSAETSNRSYMNKASKCYVPNRRI